MPKRRLKSMIVRAVLPLLVTLAGAMPARAQSCTVNMSGINFGSVNLLSGAAVDSTSTININCTNTLNLSTNVRICLNMGTGSGGMAAPYRTMANGSTMLQYQLYQDLSRTTPWGSADSALIGGPRVLDFVLLPLTTLTTTRTLHARIMPNQSTMPGGTYSSTFAGADMRVNWTPYTIVAPACSSVTQNPSYIPFTVQTVVDRTCSVAAQNLNFGSHGLLKNQVDASAQMSITCTSGLPFSVSLNGGLSNALPTQRKMVKGSHAITYGLYKDAARTQPWGNAVGQLGSGTGTGLTQTYGVYGRVPAQITPPPGNYSDTVVITISY